MSERSSSSVGGEFRSTSSVEVCAGGCEEIAQQLWCGWTSSSALSLKTPGAKNADAALKGGRGAAATELLCVRFGACVVGDWDLGCAGNSLEFCSGLACWRERLSGLCEFCVEVMRELFSAVGRFVDWSLR